MMTIAKTRVRPVMRSKILVVDADEEKNYHVDDYLLRLSIGLALCPRLIA